MTEAPRRDAGEAEVRRLFSERTDSYLRFVRSVGYPLAVRAYFARCPLLRSGLRILDAGCGSGIVSLAVRRTLLARGLGVGGIDAFDLTPAMLERFRHELDVRGIPDVRLAEANVLELDALPAGWIGYDLVVSASMLEYIPRNALPTALAGLRARLSATGAMVLFITRRNWLMKPLIGRWWRGNLYTRTELRAAFQRAGFSGISFSGFPLLYKPFDVWGHIVEAHSGWTEASSLKKPRRPSTSSGRAEKVFENQGGVRSC